MYIHLGLLLLGTHHVPGIVPSICFGPHNNLRKILTRILQMRN